MNHFVVFHMSIYKIPSKMSMNHFSISKKFPFNAKAYFKEMKYAHNTKTFPNRIFSMYREGDENRRFRFDGLV